MKLKNDTTIIINAIKTLLETCITPIHETREDFLIRVHTNNEKIKKTLKEMED